MGVKKKAITFFNDTYRENFYFMPGFTPEHAEEFIRETVPESQFRHPSNCLAYAVLIANGRTGGIFIWLPDDKPVPQNISFLTHECVHAANYVFMTRGLKLDLENDEAHAYLIQYIFLNCVKALRWGR